MISTTWWWLDGAIADAGGISLIGSVGLRPYLGGSAGLYELVGGVSGLSPLLEGIAGNGCLLDGEVGLIPYNDSGRN